MKPLVSILLASSLSGCAALNVAINRPPCCPCPLEESAKPAHDLAATRKWESHDGTQFPYLEALPKSGKKPKAVVILVPGWDGTTGDFRPLTRALVRRGYAVYGTENRYQRYDPVALRHGWVSDWHAWERDLRAFTGRVRQWCPGVPVYYHGHSMGCLIALQAAAGPEPLVDGLILQSPAIALMPDHEPAGMRALRALLFWVRPPHLLAMNTFHFNLTGDAKWDCAWMASSDRVHAGYTGRFFNEASRMGHEALGTSRKLRLPVLALEGDKDQAATVITKPGRLRQYILEDLHADGRGYDASYLCYAEGHHLMTAGDVADAKGRFVREDVIDDIVRWLDAHAGQHGSSLRTSPPSSDIPVTERRGSSR